jgi:hypothetical protein
VAVVLVEDEGAAESLQGVISPHRAGGEEAGGEECERVKDAAHADEA